MVGSGCFFIRVIKGGLHKVTCSPSLLFKTMSLVPMKVEGKSTGELVGKFSSQQRGTERDSPSFSSGCCCNRKRCKGRHREWQGGEKENEIWTLVIFLSHSTN